MTKKIEFTNRAKIQIEKIISQDKLKKYFRISVKGGGCSGFKYNFSFDNKINKEDIIFDKTVIDDIEKAILESDLGFNPSNNGNSIMITFPPLSAERRQELVKVASKIIEDGRISVRNIRREIIQSAKRIEDEQNISEDNMKTFLDDIQEVTDSFITRLNALQKEKEVEILDK